MRSVHLLVHLAYGLRHTCKHEGQDKAGQAELVMDIQSTVIVNIIWELIQILTRHECYIT
jgi:hypothetical protein